MNQANATHCDITVAAKVRGRFNPGKTLDEFLNKSLVSYSFGQRLHLSYSPDLSSVEVLTRDLYFPNRVIDLNAQYGSASKQALDVCRIMDAHCPNVTAANGFSSIADCVAQLERLPATTVNTQGVATVDGNSFGCLNLHAALAVHNSKHCPHLSIIPMMDSDGKYKCQTQGENNLSPDDIFDDEDLALFELVGISNGLGKEQAKVFRNDDKDFPNCVDGSLLDVVANDDLSPPASLFCNDYLHSRDATGEQNTTYWLALFVLFLGMRSAAFGILHRKASRSSSG